MKITSNNALKLLEDSRGITKAKKLKKEIDTMLGFNVYGLFSDIHNNL